MMDFVVWFSLCLSVSPVPEGDEEPAEGTKKIKHVDKHVTTVVTHSLHEEKYMQLGADFYSCDALDLAPRLLGKLLRRDDVILQITEVGCDLTFSSNG